MSIHISGRRWFNKNEGNTYHSVTIFADGKQIAYVPYVYGYDDQYLQTAVDKLKELGYIDYNGPFSALNLLGLLDASWDSVDVARKKDL